MDAATHDRTARAIGADLSRGDMVRAQLAFAYRRDVEGRSMFTKSRGRDAVAGPSEADLALAVEALRKPGALCYVNLTTNNHGIWSVLRSAMHRRQLRQARVRAEK